MKLAKNQLNSLDKPIYTTQQDSERFNLCGLINLIKSDNFSSGFLLGLFSTMNGFMFHIGPFNLRFADIFFFVLFGYCLISKPSSRLKLKYRHNFKEGLSIVSFLALWLIVCGLLNFNSYIEIYQIYFIKYLINKLIWIPLYAILFMLYGGKSFLLGVFWGIGICGIINSIFVIHEYILIVNGIVPRYDYLSKIGIFVSEKKYAVFNQGLIRPTGLMIDPNYTGAYAGIALIFFDYLRVLTKKSRYGIYALICSIPMFILFSRTALFSFFLCFVISVCYKIFSCNKQFRILSPQIVLIICAATILILFYLFKDDFNVSENLTRRLYMKDGSSSQRLDYLSYYMNHTSIFQWLFGSGVDGNSLTYFFGINEVLHPESSYISFIIENGIIFTALFICLMIYVFRRLIRRNYYYAFIFLYINLIGISYNFLGDRLYYFLFVCLLLYSYCIFR